MPAHKPAIALITPALADANNGNWQTAQRWAGFLARDYEVLLCKAWRGEPAAALIALHARRSADSVAAWSRAVPRRPLAVVLTGTDLYRDLVAGDADTQRSLGLADKLIVLQESAPDDVPAEHRAKCVVCFQSTPSQPALPKPTQHLRALMVGHLRDVKDPRTYFAAARALASRQDILLDHIGAALDTALGDEAQTLMREQPRYRWLGALPHASALEHIRGAHVLVHPSTMEGGAHVVMEAVCRGTPVLASRIAGNVGLLGRDYGGYFEPGDAAGLSRQLQRLRDVPAMLQGLGAHCDQRAPLFDPERERATLLRTMAQLLETQRT